MRCKAVADVVDQYRNAFRIVLCKYESWPGVQISRPCMLFHVSDQNCEHLPVQSGHRVLVTESIELNHSQ